MLEVLPELARAGHRQVLLAPAQFVADHLETLFDIDIGGKEPADEAGIEHFARVPAPNDSPEFAGALAAIVRENLAGWSGSRPAPARRGARGPPRRLLGDAWRR